MKKATHTPGPWTVQDNTDLLGEGHQLRVDSDDGAVAECGRKPFVDDTMRANARLIAAAPDMLVALEIIVEMHPQHPAASYARQALAKVRSK